MADVWLSVPQGHCSVWPMSDCCVWPMSDCQYHKGTALYGRCLTASTTRALLCMADVWLSVPQGHCSVWPMSDCQYHKGTAVYGRCLTAVYGRCLTVSTTRALLCMADVWLLVPQGHCCVWPMSDCQYHKGTALYGRCLTASTTRALLCMADVWLSVPQGHCCVWPMSDCSVWPMSDCSVWPMSDCSVWPMSDCSVWPMSDCQYHKGTAVYGRCLTASTARALLCMADVWLPVRQGHCSVWPMLSLQYRLYKHKCCFGVRRKFNILNECVLFTFWYLYLLSANEHASHGLALYK